MEENLKDLAVEARARLIWGTPKSEVIEWLNSEGLSPSQVAVIIETSWRERNIEIRRIGLRDFVIGSLALLGSLILFIMDYKYGNSHIRQRNYGYGISIFLFGFGLWRLIRAVDRLLSGAKTKGSITEM